MGAGTRGKIEVLDWPEKIDPDCPGSIKKSFCSTFQLEISFGPANPPLFIFRWQWSGASRTGTKTGRLG